MNVSFRQLRVFTEVAQHGSMARAAEALHLTPPAVSMQIKELEAQVGLPLFDRAGRKRVAVHRRRILPGAHAAHAGRAEGCRRRHGAPEAPGARPADHRPGQHRQVLRAAAAGALPRGAPGRGRAVARGRQPQRAGGADAKRRGRPVGDGPRAEGDPHALGILCRTPAGLRRATGPSAAARRPARGERAGALPDHRARARLGHAHGDGEVLRRAPLRQAHCDGDVEQRDHQAGGDGRPGPELPVTAHHGPGAAQRAAAAAGHRWMRR